MRTKMTIALLGIGSSPHVYRLGDALAKRGHRIHVISEDKFAPFPHLPALTFHSYASTASFPAKVGAVRAILKDIRPDVLNSHTVNLAGFVGVGTGFHPHVITAWGSDILQYPRRSRLDYFQAAVALRCADWLLSDAPDIRDAMDEIGGHPLHNDLQLWGVDVQHFTPEGPRSFRQKIGVGDVPLVLSSRVMTAFYNHEKLVEAWPKVLQAVPSAKLVLVRYLPDENFEAALRETIRKQGNEDSILWIEPIPYAELPTVYREIDVLVSIPKTDGTPMTVLEAMACGSPIVACDRPALRPWVVHGETGELTDPFDPASIANCLIAVLTASEPIKTHLRQTGPAWIRERADREVCLDSLERIFQQAGEQKGHGHRRTVRNLLKI